MTSQDRAATKPTGTPLWAWLGTAGFALGFGAQLPTFPTFVVNLPHGSPATAGLLASVFSAAAIAGRLPFLAGRLRGHGRSLLIIGALLAAASTSVPLFESSVLSLALMRTVGGLGDALFLTALLSSTISGEGRAGTRQRKFATVTLVLHLGFMSGPVVGEQVRAWYGYDGVWVASSALLASGCVAALSIHKGRRPPPLAANSGHGWRPMAAIFGPFLAFAVAPAALATFGAIAMHRAGASNAAPLFVALSVATISSRLPIALGYLTPVKPTFAYAVSASGCLLLAAGPGSVLTLLAGAVIVGLCQGVALPACARQVVEHIPPERHRAAMALSTIALDCGFILAGAALGPIASTAGMAALFAAASGACCVAALGALIFRPSPHHNHDKVQEENVGLR